MNFFLKVFTCVTFVSLPSLGQEVVLDSKYVELYKEYQEDGFTDDEIIGIYNILIQKDENSIPGYLDSFWAAVRNPYAPEDSDTGERFFAALSWYNDTTTGNKDGEFSLEELTKAMYDESVKYVKFLMEGEDYTDSRIRSWKMLQKLKLLELKILILGLESYPYSPREMREIDYNEPWNLTHTINNKEEFQESVIEASYDRPVLVKFGLTYCVHCLLLENLGSVPAVAAKYDDRIDVYKLWWNPHDAAYGELNSIAENQGVSSSPWFILYVDGEIVKSGYAFPDENGDGMEDFLDF